MFFSINQIIEELIFPDLMWSFSLLILTYIHLKSSWIAVAISFLEKEMATRSSTLAWKIPWIRSMVGCSSWGHYELDTTEQLHFHFQQCLLLKFKGFEVIISFFETDCLQRSRYSLYVISFLRISNMYIFFLLIE